MADLAITTSAVVPGFNAEFGQGIAAEAIAEGMGVYLDTSVGQYRKGYSAGSAAQGLLAGVAINSAAGAGQPITFQTAGYITLGATLAVGVAYNGGNGAGGICDNGQATTGWYVTTLGVAVSTTVLNIAIAQHGGVPHA